MYANANFKRIMIIVTRTETLHVVLFDENVYRDNESTRDMIIQTLLKLLLLLKRRVVCLMKE